MSALSEPVPFEVYEAGVYLHGTKADLAVGDLLVSGQIYVMNADGSGQRRLTRNPGRLPFFLVARRAENHIRKTARRRLPQANRERRESR